MHDTHDYHELKELCLSKSLKFPPCMIVNLEGERHTVDTGLPPDNVLTMYHELFCSEESLSRAVMNSLIDQVSNYKAQSSAARTYPAA